tara:strand:- start:2401 stop:2892 length:492 start_codon:yes stop_codon:yes gene_type:complete
MLDNDEFLLELEDREREVSLSRNEALYLSDSVTLMIEKDTQDGIAIGTMRAVSPSAPLPVPIEIIDKVGMAVLYTTDPDNIGKDYWTTFSYNELYLIREICQSFVKVGNEQVGFNLKRKIYKALLKEQYEGEKLANQLLEVSSEEATKESVNIYLSNQNNPPT